jgi:tetratricopeptide (TPR) repeat protein
MNEAHEEGRNPSQDGAERRFRYRAFISYSHADRKFARWLMGKLEGYRVPKRLVGKATPLGPVPPNLRPVFRDRDELASASDLGERIQSVLGESAALVVICSPAAARSRWVAEEVLAYKRLHGPDRVFCVIIDGDPQADDEDRQCFPRPLRFRVGDHGELSDVPIEPVAADIRAEGDGRRRAMMKLIAGLLGVAYDELVRRELVRRHRRMTAITIGALAGMAVASALAGIAYVARQDAERRREQAEDLLGFLVDDMQDRLVPLGRLDVLETVLDKTMDYFAGLGQRDLTDTALARQSQALVRIGEVRTSQGRFEEALDSFRRAYESSAALVRRQPDNAGFLFDRGQAEYWVGYIHWREKRLEQAQTWFVRYRDTALELVAMDATNRDWITESVYGYHNLAVLEVQRGRLQDADQMFESEAVILEGLLLSEPEGRTLRYDLADTLSWRGSIAIRLGEFERAERLYRQSVELLDYLVQQEPGNKEFLHRAVVARGFIAKTLALTGRPGESLAMLEEDLEIQRALVRHDPGNKDWLQTLVILETRVARLVGIDGHASRATALAADAMDHLEPLIDLKKSDPTFMGKKIECYELNSRLNLRSGQIEEATRLMEMALETARETYGADMDSHDNLATLALALVLSGDVNRAAGGMPAARAAWREAVRLLQPMAADSTDYEILDPLIRSLISLDQRQRAEPLIIRLQATGYRPLEPWPGN